jgi:NAD(P)-dependent dehydrogenase (short-subunit alcohol dehydrogenase family)
MLKYSQRGFKTVVFETCRHWPRCDVHISEKITQILSRSFPELIQKEKRPKLDIDDFIDQGRFTALDGYGELEAKPEFLGMDYAPTPLLYGASEGPSDLISQIQQLETEENLVSRLRYKITSNFETFRKVLMTVPKLRDRRRGAGNTKGRLSYVPMQFKFVKDAWISRRVAFSTGFYLCYMCGKDVEHDGENGKENQKGTSGVGKGKGGKDMLREGDVEEESAVLLADYKFEVGSEGTDESGGGDNSDDDDDDGDQEMEDADSDKENGGDDDDDDDDDGDAQTSTPAAPSTSAQQIATDIPNDAKDPTTPVKRHVALCTECACLNASKVSDPIPLPSGSQAVVTGGRTKIGRAVALRLLRNGATVHVTTRFPLLLLRSYWDLEEDKEMWWDRLHVYDLDLRDLNSLDKFVGLLKDKVPRLGKGTLDLLVQNAAQTVRRPAEFWKPLVKAEATVWEELNSGVSGVEGMKMLKRWIRVSNLGGGAAVTGGVTTAADGALMSLSASSSVSAWRQQTAEDLGAGESVVSELAGSALRTLMTFPDSAAKDAEASKLIAAGSSSESTSSTLSTLVASSEWNVVSHGKEDPQDPRSETTWNTTLQSVPASEMAEVMIINSLAPVLLVQKLRPLFQSPFQSTSTSAPSSASSSQLPPTTTNQRQTPAFIINVTSREGSFSASSKQESQGWSHTALDDAVHPHTNMAKAALNRFTQTTSRELLAEGIYMVAVDPGWVSVMGPRYRVSATGDIVDATTTATTTAPSASSSGGNVSSGGGTLGEGSGDTNTIASNGMGVEIVPPLTHEDGAARILDPVVMGLKNGGLYHGVLFRNFKVSTW